MNPAGDPPPPQRHPRHRHGHQACSSSLIVTADEDLRQQLRDRNRTADPERSDTCWTGRAIGPTSNQLSPAIVRQQLVDLAPASPSLSRPHPQCCATGRRSSPSPVSWSVPPSSTRTRQPGPITAATAFRSAPCVASRLSPGASAAFASATARHRTPAPPAPAKTVRHRLFAGWRQHRTLNCAGTHRSPLITLPRPPVTRPSFASPAAPTERRRCDPEVNRCPRSAPPSAPPGFLQDHAKRTPTPRDIRAPLIADQKSARNRPRP